MQTIILNQRHSVNYKPNFKVQVKNKILDGAQEKLKESLRTLNLKRIEKQLNPIGLYSKSQKVKLPYELSMRTFILSLES